MAWSILPRSLLARDAHVVARELLGHVLVHETPEGARAGRIVETEAYFGPPGAHAHLAERSRPESGAGEAEERGRDGGESEAYFGPPGAHAHLADGRSHAPAWARRVAREGDPASHSFNGRTERNDVMFGEPGFAYVYLIYGVHRCVNVSTGTEGRPEAVLLRALEPLEGQEAMLEDRGTTEPTNAASGPGKLTQALGITREYDGHDLLEPPLYIARGDAVTRVVSTPRVGVRGGEDLPLRFHVEGNPHVSR